MRRRLPLTSLLLCVLAVSCASKTQTTKPVPFGNTSVPPRIGDGNAATAAEGAGTTGGTGTPVIPGGNVPNTGRFKATAEEDIVYTDPDNPEAGIPELSSVLAAPAKGPWEESETIAKQRSGREGKPLLIWFTDSQGSPMCKALADELFSRMEFGDWAKEKLVRLKVDVVVAKDPNMSLDDWEDRRTRVMNYNAELKKRYKIMGYPSLVMLSPGGEVVGRYRGFRRGEGDLMWGQLKHAEAVASEAYKGWKTSLEKKGYREWQDKKGRKIMAKLVSYSKGTLVLIEPDGSRAQTKESNLSDQDRAWIDQQKKLRQIQ